MSRRHLWLLIDLVCVFVLFSVIVFALANSSDRSPLQWESAFLCMFTWLILPVVWGVLWIFRRPRQPKDRPGFEVLPVTPSIDATANTTKRDAPSHPH